MTGDRTHDWSITLAITWGLLFASLHLAWAAGSRVLLVDPVAADAAFGRSSFQIYNAGVVVASVAAAGLAFAAARGTTIRGLGLARLVWLPAVLLTTRGAIGLLQLGRSLAISADFTWGTWSVDLYILLGGVIFARVAWRCAPFRRRIARREDGAFE